MRRLDQPTKAKRPPLLALYRRWEWFATSIRQYLRREDYEGAVQLYCHHALPSVVSDLLPQEAGRAAEGPGAAWGVPDLSQPAGATQQQQQQGGV